MEIRPTTNSQFVKYWKGITGYQISEQESARLRKKGNGPVYGEINFGSVERVHRILDVNNKDIFVDLGSGVGKVVAQTFLNTKCKLSIGVEVSKERHEKAEKAHTRIATSINAQAEQINKNLEREKDKCAKDPEGYGLLMASKKKPKVPRTDLENLLLIKGDVRDLDIYEDATILFVNAVGFSDDLCDLLRSHALKLKQLRAMVVVNPVPFKFPRSRLTRKTFSISMDMSWVKQMPVWFSFFKKWRPETEDENDREETPPEIRAQKLAALGPKVSWPGR